MAARHRRRRLAASRGAGLLLLGLVTAACGAADRDWILISGSSTVEPISALNAEKFVERSTQPVALTVEGPGTGDGFELFCNGETDISDASRPIKDEEIAVCEQNGIEFTELEVGIDGIAVLTSPENDAVSCLGFGDLYALLGPESEGFETWADANVLAQEVGGIAASSYPDEPLEITAPGEESGTYDSFVELTLEDIAGERDEEPVTRKDYVASANDNVIIEGLSGSAHSLGWVGFAFFTGNADVVKALEIDGGSGCVAPTETSIADGSYPVARSLYIYVNDLSAAEKPDVSAYVDFYLSDEGLASVREVGYVSLPPERIEATRSAWEAVTAG